jgi:acetylornithine deacetylase/succinyl-diaminopimelate desuccinylase-like protein
MMTQQALDYARANGERFRQELHDWLRIPSVSTLPERKGDVRRAGQWLVDHLRKIGFERAELHDTAGHPIVYGEWLKAGAGAPTVLIYGHYDVQPADREADGWTTDPFEPVEQDGKLYARGSSDDKGQTFTHVKAIESLLATEGKLPVNVKMLIEGEEEVSSAHLVEFVSAHKDLLKADVCVISDTALLTRDTPSIVNALRGLVYMEIHVQGPRTDLHSGGFGGTVHNPAQALAEIIAQLHNPDGSVAVPGFYDDVLVLTDDDRAELRKADWEFEDWAASTGLAKSWGEPQFTLRERIGARPTLEVNGMVSGFYGEGAKTVLPGKAMAKISCRLVANQNPHRIYEQIRDYVASITPDTVQVKVVKLHEGNAAYMDPKLPVMQAAIKAYEQGWGKRPVFMREGGSIPIVANFQQDLNVPVVLMGFGLNSDGAHGPDEHFYIDMFHKGIDTLIYFYHEVAAQH